MKNKEVQKRLKSKVVWAAIIVMVANLFVQYGFVEFAQIFKDVMNLVTDVLVLFGVLNDPTSKNSF